MGMGYYLNKDIPSHFRFFHQQNFSQFFPVLFEASSPPDCRFDCDTFQEIIILFRILFTNFIKLGISPYLPPLYAYVCGMWAGVCTY